MSDSGINLGVVELHHQHVPVVDNSGTKIEPVPQHAEHPADIVVLGPLVEPHAAAIVQVHGELAGESLAQDLHTHRDLLLVDALVFLQLGGGLHILPGQRAPVKVHKDIAHGHHIIPPRGFDAFVGANGGISGSSG